MRSNVIYASNNLFFSISSQVIQVHETQLVHHGMMVVGDSGSGKSTNLKVLCKALTNLYEENVTDNEGFYKQIDCLFLNPRSISAGELYGEFNPITKEWKDGLVPKMVRDCVKSLYEGSDNRKWIIFDGPIDTSWIEVRTLTKAWTVTNMKAVENRGSERRGEDFILQYYICPIYSPLLLLPFCLPLSCSFAY